MINKIINIQHISFIDIINTINETFWCYTQCQSSLEIYPVAKLFFALQSLNINGALIRFLMHKWLITRFPSLTYF